METLAANEAILTIVATLDGTVKVSEAALSTKDLRAKTIWIRDELEPHVARLGPRFLGPDTVLELNTFFTTLHGLIPRITIEHLQASRLHRALILISGRGTRWPSKLIVLCDLLINELTARFGKLDMIRSTLYEKGGRLEAFQDEKQLGRHGLIMKWLSDPASLVSPFNAHETGHLGFKPGHWWVHPVYAFYSGIIDSPDPNGGISADDDGAYAILLTGHDEVAFDSAESFQYRCHPDDTGRFRLMNAIVPSKPSIRILRSHTLHSPHGPTAGVRYDGLYTVMGYAMHMVKGRLVYDVTMHREMDQISIRECQLHPTAEEVDDYIEYKRLREERQVKFEEPSTRPSTSLGQQLMQHDHLELAKPLSMPRTLVEQSSRHTLAPEESSGRPQGPSNPLSQDVHVPVVPVGSMAAMLKPARAEGDSTETPSEFYQSIKSAFFTAPPDFDGSSDGAHPWSDTRFSTQRDSSGQRGVDGTSGTTLARSDTVRSVLGPDGHKRFSVSNGINLQRDSTEDEIRKDSGYNRGTSVKGPTATDPRHSNLRQSAVMNLESASIECLATKFDELRSVTMRKGSMGMGFSEDLKQIQLDLGQLRLDTARSTKARSRSIFTQAEDEIEAEFVQHCLKCVEDDLRTMRDRVQIVTPTQSPDKNLVRLLDGMLDAQDSAPKDGIMRTKSATSTAENEYVVSNVDDEDEAVEELRDWQKRYSSRFAASDVEGDSTLSQEWLMSDDETGLVV